MLEHDNIHKIVREYGLIPIDNKSIIVTYAGENLSDKIAKFFSPEFYILQICKAEVVFIPLTQISMIFSINYELSKEILLSIPISSIKSIKVEKKYFDYEIKMDTIEGFIQLLVKENGLDELRSTGGIIKNSLRKYNWHKNNLEATLNDLIRISL